MCVGVGVGGGGSVQPAAVRQCRPPSDSQHATATAFY